AQNIGMTLFWVVFLLGLTYLTLIVGDLYALINPWKLGIQGLESLGLNLSKPRLRYSRRWGYWPAFAGYFALIWMELFIGPKPFALAVALILYSLSVWAGCMLFGKQIWLHYADPFCVLFRLVGLLAPIEYRPGSD